MNFREFEEMSLDFSCTNASALASNLRELSAIDRRIHNCSEGDEKGEYRLATRIRMSCVLFINLFFLSLIRFDDVYLKFCDLIHLHEQTNANGRQLRLRNRYETKLLLSRKNCIHGIFFDSTIIVLGRMRPHVQKAHGNECSM